MRRAYTVPTLTAWEKARLKIYHMPKIVIALCRRRACWICHSRRLCDHREFPLLLAELEAMGRAKARSHAPVSEIRFDEGSRRRARSVLGPGASGGTGTHAASFHARIALDVVE